MKKVITILLTNTNNIPNIISIWVNLLYNQAKQKAKNNNSGYTLTEGGDIISAEYRINYSSLIGIACGCIESSAKYKDQKKGDKTNAYINIFSLYGLKYFIKEWFAEAMLSYGFGKVKNNKGRLVVIGQEQAVGKYTINVYSSQK